MCLCVTSVLRIARTSKLLSFQRSPHDPRSRAQAGIAYIEDGEVFKGGYIEIGVALGNGKPVYLIGNFPGTFMNHPLVSCFDSLDDAFAAL